MEHSLTSSSSVQTIEDARTILKDVVRQSTSTSAVQLRMAAIDGHEQTNSTRTTRRIISLHIRRILTNFLSSVSSLTGRGMRSTRMRRSCRTAQCWHSLRRSALRQRWQWTPPTRKFGTNSDSSTLESASSRAHGFLSSAVVSNTDDPTLPCNTFRVWVIGIFFTIIGTGINQVGGSSLPTCSEVSDQFPTVL